jgi:integrase
MAVVRQRGDKWQAIVRRKGYGQVARSFTTKRDAETWARQQEIALDRAELPVSTGVLKGMTLRDLLIRYRNEVSSRKRSREMEQRWINGFLRQRMVDKSLAALRPEDFAAYRDERLAGAVPSTVSRMMVILQHAYEAARRDWGLPIPVNPVKQVRKPGYGAPRERRLGPGELERLLGACSAKRTPYLAPLILLALETAMRRGELLAMRWGDINWNRNTIRIPVAKNGHSRTIPLSPQGRELLLRWGDGIECEGLAPRAAETVFPVGANAVRLAWDRLCRRAGVTDLHFHDLRHEAISRFFEKGLSVPEVALISGHRDYRMLARYTHMNAERVAHKLATVA